MCAYYEEKGEINKLRLSAVRLAQFECNLQIVGDSWKMLNILNKQRTVYSTSVYSVYNKHKFIFHVNNSENLLPEWKYYCWIYDNLCALTKSKLDI